MVRSTSDGVDGGVHYDEVALTPIAQFIPTSAPVLTFTDSGLSPGTTYSYTVSAYDIAGNNSAQSSPPAVATTEPDVIVDTAGAKEFADEQSVSIAGVVVTAIFDTYLYVSEPDRFAGTKVVPVQMPEELTVNDEVNVMGVMRTANGERYVGDAVVTWIGVTGGVDPLGVNNSAVGGGDWEYDSGTGAGQRGITGATGTNNIGLLITIWGSYSQIDTTTFHVDDGSGTPVRCVVPTGVTLDPNWQFVVVTGISSCYEDAGVLHRRILVRDQGVIPIQ